MLKPMISLFVLKIELKFSYSIFRFKNKIRSADVLLWLFREKENLF